MIRPSHKNILKNKLKIDQYQTKTFKKLEDQDSILIGKSILIPKVQGQNQNKKPEQSKKIRFNLQNEEQKCQCIRFKRHDSGDKKKQVFRLKKSFTTHKHLGTKLSIESENKISIKNLDDDPEQEPTFSHDIITFLKRRDILKQKQDSFFEIHSENLLKVVDCLTSRSKATSSQIHSHTVLETSDNFIVQLNSLLKIKQQHENRYEKQERKKALQKQKQQIKKKQAILNELQNKIKLKTQNIKILEYKIDDLVKILQKYERKATKIDHYLDQVNRKYIQELCLQYHKHISSINSFSILVETEEQKNNKINYSFAQIERSVRQEFAIINQQIQDYTKVQKQLNFVKKLLLRVMQLFRSKYDQIQKQLSQKTLWIAQLIAKIKKLEEFFDFKQQYLQNLINQYSLSFLRAQGILNVFKNVSSSQENRKEFAANLQRVLLFQKRMYQNYMLSTSLH